MAKLADSESQYPHLYHQAEKIEQARMSKDLLYRVIMDPDTTELNKAVKHFVTMIRKHRTDGGKLSSRRMNRMLDLCQADTNRLMKHSLILFGLQLEPWAVNYFMEQNRCPPEKLSSFISTELKDAVSQLLKGSYTSLQAFVEDARWRYVVL